MTLVSHYAEACDDLGHGLFAQTEQVTQERVGKAHAVWTQIDAEVKRLHAATAATAEPFAWYSPRHGDTLTAQQKTERAAYVPLDAAAYSVALFTGAPVAPALVPLTDEQIEPMFRARSRQPTEGQKDDWYFYAWGVADGESEHGIKP